jgi:hypothetical protein
MKIFHHILVIFCKLKRGRTLMQPLLHNYIIWFLSLSPFVSSSLRPSVPQAPPPPVSSYSPLIAVIPGSFFPSMYSSIAPPPVET